MRSSRVGAIPSEIGELIDDLDDIFRRLRILEAPSGESLASTVAKLQALVANAVSPVSIYRLDTAPAITSVAGDFATVSVVVPEGYTRAIVDVTASATLRSNDAAGGWALMNVAAIVTPSGGASFYNQWASIDGQKYGGASAPGAVVLDGLTAGSSISVAARVSFPGTYTLPRAAVAGSVLFLR
ncbi:hypothetical protein [Microbacterium cremeum]|uniref:hypothetical protein n=1 Tax=Microbacterium cremeum TaxID=2782169 RepID=UPI00188961AD|nr:hypothetical protein [Microbacterium cremeum]